MGTADDVQLLCRVPHRGSSLWEGNLPRISGQELRETQNCSAGVAATHQAAGPGGSQRCCTRSNAGCRGRHADSRSAATATAATAKTAASTGDSGDGAESNLCAYGGLLIEPHRQHPQGRPFRGCRCGLGLRGAKLKTI